MHKLIILALLTLSLISCKFSDTDSDPETHPVEGSDPLGYVVLDDFEDDAPSFNTLARRWFDKTGLTVDSIGDAWNAYYSENSAVMNPGGGQVPNVFDATKATAPFSSLIGNWEGSGRQLHLKARLQGHAYPEVGLGTGILGGWLTTFVDMTRLTAVQFRAKGRGEWNATLFTDSVESDPEEHWGHMCVTLNLESDWKTYTFPVGDFKPMHFSKQERNKLTWEDVRKKTYGFGFANSQSYGIEADDSLEIWLDDIRLIGLEDADLGI